MCHLSRLLLELLHRKISERVHGLDVNLKHALMVDNPPIDMHGNTSETWPYAKENFKDGRTIRHKTLTAEV
jgi:hypothetical protein